MPTFPTKESEVLMLAGILNTGLRRNAALYPAPPVSPNTLGWKAIAFTVACDHANLKLAAARQAVTAKDEAFAALTDDMKADLRYAENTVRFDDDKLKLLGWGARAAPTAAPPGQPRSLEAPRQGEGWIRLDWKAPADGGAVTVYRLQRRQRPEGPWQDIGLSMKTQSTLLNQDRGKELEYRVIAVNKAGESASSNSVMAVL